MSLCRLRIHAPTACPLFVIFSVDGTRLPEPLRRHEGKFLAVLEKGGTLEVVDSKATTGNVLGLNLNEWAKVFPGLDLERSWEAEAGKAAGMVALVAGTTLERHAWQGDACHTLPELRRLLAEGATLADVVQRLDPCCPSYPIGSVREQVTVE